MSRTSRISPLLLPVATIFAMVGIGACFNFDTAYNNYCADTGLCDGGNPSDGGGRDGGDGGQVGTDGGNDGGADSGTPDSGTPDSGTPDSGTPDGGGGRDGGTTACLNFGAACTAYGQCCDPEDGGAGQAMGCSRFGYCQPRPRECHEDAYKCSQNSDCCSGRCVNGTCSACADGNTGAACGQAVDCCIYFYSACDSTNHCTSGSGGSPNDYHCASADWCSSGYCEFTTSGSPPEGRCKTPSTGCKTLGQTVGGSETCCGGLTTPDAGTSQNCCMPDNSLCKYDSSCCSGSCLGGQCVPSNKTSLGLGDHCRDNNSNLCSGQLLCDPVSKTCTGRWCMEAPLPYPGCCSFTAWNGNCHFADGRNCLNPGATCTSPSQCCSGSCTSGKCDTIIFY